MKASRAQIKTAKAVKTVEARLELLETQGSEIYALLVKTFGILEKAEKRAMEEFAEAVPPPKAKPDRPEHDQNVPKARTVRKRGGA